jgi:Ribonuclease G/E
MRVPDTIVVSALPGDRRVAWLADGVLIRYALDAGGDSGSQAGIRAGDIIVGRVIRVHAGLAAAFVDIGEARAGFLMLHDGPARPEGGRRALAEGDRVLVQVIRAAEGGKGAKLSGRLRPEGLALAAEGAAVNARPPSVLQRAPDPFVSALRESVHPRLARVVVDDLTSAAAVRAACPELSGCIEIPLLGPPPFAAFGIAEQLEAALKPTLVLPSGGALTISETPALVAVDVDAGATTAADVQATARAVNLEAIVALKAALDLRALGGHIVIDAVPMRNKHDREEVLAALRAALVADALQTDIGGFTRLGLIELTRARVGPSLRQQLGHACAACDGGGVVLKPAIAAGDALRVAVTEARLSPGLAPVIVAPTPVIAALEGPMAAARAACEARLGRAIGLKETAALGPARFRIEAA